MDLIKINTMSQYRRFISGKRILNNSFTEQDIQKYMARESLWGINTDSPLLLYDEKSYYQMCFTDISAPMLSAALESVNKPVICYIREDNRPKNNTPAFQKLLCDSGFNTLQTFCEFELKIGEHTLNLNNLNGLALKEVWSNKDYLEILNLWNDNIPTYELAATTADDVRSYADTGRLVALEEIASGKIVAAACFETLLGRSLIRHVVVDKTYRNLGIGTIIVWQTVSEAQKRGSKAWAWIAQTNEPSKKAFEKNGFNMTSTKMHQYILRRD